MFHDKLRKPAVAGQFYPSDSGEIRRLISSFLPDEPFKEDALGCVLPHAGYFYSGRVAAETVSGINIRDTVVLLGPNHTGRGEVFSVARSGRWQTPLGDLRIDSSLAGLFLAKSDFLRADDAAHQDEHSLEVELPILQYFKTDFKIVPISFGSEDPGALDEIAAALAGAVSGNNLLHKVTFIASSDLTHYQPESEARRKDNLAIEAILALDEKELAARVRREKISMCGFAPVTVMIKAAKLLGAKKGRLVRYQTSGDASGETDSVVGYAGITIN